MENGMVGERERLGRGEWARETEQRKREFEGVREEGGVVLPMVLFEGVCPPVHREPTQGTRVSPN
jgi:hypothetical protein